MMLIGIKRKEDKKGSIFMPQERADVEMRRNICVEVIAQGPDCYKDRERYPNGPWCKVGDWVLVPEHVGQRAFKVDGDDREYRIINEDSILAVVDNPEVVERV
jgi:co-chaperonin GroES (HSP10)